MIWRKALFKKHMHIVSIHQSFRRRALELLVSFAADVMRLKPVEDLLGDLFFKDLTLHLGLLGKDLLYEHFDKALFHLAVDVLCHGHIIFEVDLWASLWGSILARGLITMPDVHPEHELVGDFIEVRDIILELCVVGL